MNITITFDPVEHEYRADGIKVPSVTGVIPYDGSVKRFIGAAVYTEATEDGVRCHRLAEDYLKNGIDGKMSDPFLIAFEKFLSEQSLGKLVLCEETLYSRRYGFAGRPDMIFEKGRVDLKRSWGDAKRHALQMAGYDILARENKIAEKSRKWWVLVIKNGAYELKNVFNPLAERMFLGLVQKRKIEQSLKNYFNTV